MLGAGYVNEKIDRERRLRGTRDGHYCQGYWFLHSEVLGGDVSVERVGTCGE